MRSTIALRSRVLVVALVAALAVTPSGCGVAIVPIAVWLGKVILYTAAVRASVQLVDQVLGQKKAEVNADVVRNPGDPNRGVLRSITVGKKNPDGSPKAGSVTFTDVPVSLGPSGAWIVDKYYCDTVMEPKLRAID